MKKSPLFFIYLTVFVNIVGFGMIFPLLPFYAQKFNASEATIGLLASSFAIAQFLFSPFWGRFSDRFGRKPIISIALLGISLSYFVFAFSTSLTWLFISRFLQGTFSAAALPVAQAYVADVTSKEERIKGMSTLGASIALGFIFGPAIGGTLSLITFQFPFIAASILSLLNFFSVHFYLPESLTKKGKLVIRGGFLNIKPMISGLKGNLGAFFILIFLWSYGLSNNQVAVPLFGVEELDLSAGAIALFFSAMGLTSASIQFFFLPKISKRFGERKVSILGLSFMALGLFLMPFSPFWPFMLLSMMTVALGSALARPNLTSLISKETKDGQGTTMGISSAFESFGRILGPALGGVLFYQLGYHTPFIVVAFLIALMLIYLVKGKNFLKS